jgi:spore coat protein A
VGATFVVPSPVGVSRAIAAAGRRLTKFIQPLPRPGAGIVVATPSAPDRYSFNLRQTARQLHPQLPETPFWAYDEGHLEDQAGSFGLAVVGRTGTPLTLDFTNDLPATYPSWIPVDPELTFQNSTAVRILTHLHGGFVAADSDGNPAVTEGGFLKGATQTVHYPNQAPADSTSGGMPASLLWFHDHAFGATRLNVFAGLAAAYILRDEFDTGSADNPIGIPGGEYEIPLVIQDRQFNADGTFLYPTSDIAGVTWIGEYFGDVMLVNGKVWPFTDVEPRLYRLRILNGCNARIMDLRLGVPMWQIGAEGGMWDRPVRVHNLVLAPAERADVLADFTHARGQSLVLQNSTPGAPVSTPAPALKPVMQFRVGTRVTHQGTASVPASLPGRAADLPAASKTRYITLNEVAPQTKDWTLNVNALDFESSVTNHPEMPTVGTVEDWVWVNMTADTHPMHTHLVTHQVIGRTPFDVDRFQADHGGPHGVPGDNDPTPYATGPMEPPDPSERGFKDTTRANPGYSTTVRAKFDLPTGVTAPQTYVYHCHIVEHEDNDMMLPFTVVP